MSTKKIQHYIILMIVFFVFTNEATANIFINEVQLSPVEDRFIELYNSGSSPVNLTGWYIQRKTANGSIFGSLITKTHFDGVNIKPNNYLLISKTGISNSDIVVDKLILTPSNSIQIKNSNKKIVDNVSWGDIPDGKSSQRISSGNWIIDSPTPGEANQVQSTGASNVNNNNLPDTITTPNVIDNSIVTSPQKSSPRKIAAKIIVPQIIFAKMPFNIKALVTTNKKETLTFGKFQWNLGDGTIKKFNNSKEFKHTYFYPGKYVISLNYSEYMKLKPDVSTRIVLRVISPEVIISSVGSKEDPFIEIENKSNYEITLSNWVVTAGVHHFSIPIGTVILAKSKLKFSPKITGLTKNDLNFIVLTNSEGDMSTIYPILKQKIKSSRLASFHKVNYHNNLPFIKEIKTKGRQPIIDLNKLGASASNSRLVVSSDIYPYFGLAGIILLGIFSVLFIKKKNKSYDDLEQGMRAEDIKIIE